MKCKRIAARFRVRVHRIPSALAIVTEGAVKKVERPIVAMQVARSDSHLN